MKINCGPSRATKLALKRNSRNNEHRRLTNWHSVFAWWPRPVGENDCRWLEQIERKGTWIMLRECYRWEYRAKQGATE